MEMPDLFIYLFTFIYHATLSHVLQLDFDEKKNNCLRSKFLWILSFLTCSPYFDTSHVAVMDFFFFIFFFYHKLSDPEIPDEEVLSFVYPHGSREYTGIWR